MSLKSAFAAIHRTNAEPELKFAAAMVAAAAEDARLGDCLAYEWLSSPCSLRWLVAIVPLDDDCERVRRALLSTIPEPVCTADCRDVATFQSSETAVHPVQLELPGLEDHHGYGDRLSKVRPRAPTHAVRDSVRGMETAAMSGV